jgi:eukaryotic-like serine/threonine-protein kinase
MATVYLAQDIRHDRPVALKVLHPELAASLGTERFQREIRMTARLQHPNILPVHDSGSAAGHLWYTMPYVDGETLRDRLYRERLLPIEEAVRITSEVADALGYAHEQGVVHRDIKPENILLSQGHALVADFGIARALQAGDQEGLTQTGVTVGTPAYMSPEQSVGDTVIDGRSDLYSLGCVLYEMLAGEPPYTGTSAQAIAAKRLFDPVPSARRLRETVPIQIDEALARALAKSAADRFSDTRTFGRALHETAVNRTARERPDSGTRRANTRRILIGGSILAGVTILVLAAVYAVHLSDSATGEANTLAVLPFKNLGPSADQYFADGLTEEVTSRLASLHGLGVISRTSSERYRGSTKPLRQIASELGANYVLEGSVRWEKAAGGGSRIRVTPQLIRVYDDVHLWADRFDADLAEWRNE